MIRDINSLKIGCQLALTNYNIIGYADDLIIMSPSQSGLQFLLDMVFNHLSNLDLSINTVKSKVIIFNRKGKKDQSRSLNFYINGREIEIVDNIKYLGIILCHDLSNKLDIERQSKAFLKQSFGFLRKFGTFPLDLKIFLFKTYCLSMFGSDLWSDLKGCSQALKSLKICFHKGVKKMLGIPFRSSNHEACLSADMLTFDHLRHNKIFNFGYLLKNSRSESLRPIKGYLLRHSLFVNNMNKIGEQVYGVSNILDNDKQAIQARISYVFTREPRFIGLDAVLGSNSPP